MGEKNVTLVLRVFHVLNLITGIIYGAGMIPSLRHSFLEADSYAPLGSPLSFILLINSLLAALSIAFAVAGVIFAHKRNRKIWFLQLVFISSAFANVGTSWIAIPVLILLTIPEVRMQYFQPVPETVEKKS
jgi:hypothetical protein